MKTLGWIALGGISIGIVTFAVAAGISDKDHKIGWPHRFFASGHAGRDCDGEGVAATVTGSEGRIAWVGGDKVAIAIPAKTRWRRGEGTDVVLRGDAEDLARIRLEDGTLLACGDIGDDVEVTLPGQSFREVTIAGAGELTMDDLDQPELELTLAGAGKVDASGSSDNVKLTIAGAGDARLGGLAAKRLTVNIMGAGKAEASPEDNADITIMGAGQVDLLTRPKHHDFNVYGAGKVNMPNET